MRKEDKGGQEKQESEEEEASTHPLRPKALFASSSLKTLGQQAPEARVLAVFLWRVEP